MVNATAISELQISSVQADFENRSKVSEVQSRI